MGGYVVNSGSHDPVANATVSVSGSTVDAGDTGYFLVGVGVEGESVEVTVSAPGFAPDTRQISLSVDGEILEVDFLLDPVLPGDIDGVGGTTMTDAIIALKTVAGMHTENEMRTGYETSGADVNGDNQPGMEEVLYILQRAGETR